MKRQNNIQAQIKRASEILPKIEQEYNNSLHKKEVSDDLKLDIQTFLGHLRSALDYLSKDIIEKYCPNVDKSYFPIRHDKNSFMKMMSESYPELISHSPALYSYLESIQPYTNSDNSWLAHFNKLNNENKHNDLVEQIRTETERVNVEINGGGSVNWDPSAVRFSGPGVYIGGVPVDFNTQIPVQSNTQTVTIQTWIDFKFSDIETSALHLLKESLSKIKDINTEIVKFL